MNFELWKFIAGILLAILVIIINKFWDPIAEYVGYPFDSRRRVEDLEYAVQTLVRMQADLHRLDPQPSSEQVIGWVKRVKELRDKADSISRGHSVICYDYFKRCYLGKQADTEQKTATDLIATGKEVLKEAQARPRPVRDVLPHHPQHQLPGMDSYKKKVLDFIQDDGTQTQSRLLGIWGMGGVGKTSLLKLVRDSSARYDPPFDHILFVTAGREATVGSMQNAIATIMGLPVMPDEISREGIIYNHLKDKSFLLLIDDLWKEHDLEAVGIPAPLGTVQALPRGRADVVQKYRRKVVFTTRSLDVCGRMGCAKNSIRLECLSQDNARKLFKDKVGKEIIEDTRLDPLAREIVLECSGLPLALCIIGQAMSTKKDPKEWRCVIDLWKKSKLVEITNTDEELFERLKYSYDKMTENHKKCFLMCSLWAKDKNIPKEKLIEWWVGLGLLDASNPTDEGYTITNSLVNASMLEKGDIGLDSTENSHVKMHKMIRKMALWIVNDHGRRQDTWLPHSVHRLAYPDEKWSQVERAWISSSDTSRWSSNICCPRLVMLVAQPLSLQFVPKFDEITFLDLEGTNTDKFPWEICLLVKLQYLNLSASKFDGLPLDLNQLLNLEYLRIRGIGALQTVPKGLISQLKKLQGLDLFCSGGAISHRVQYLSSLLEELVSETKYLDYFGITVHTRADIEQLCRLSRVCTRALCMEQFEDKIYLNKIDLELLSSLKNIREFTITNSPAIEELVAVGHQIDVYDGLLPYLEFLELRSLSKLQKVTWKSAGLNIRVVGIYSCAKLRHATWVGHLQSLEELTISDCPEFEQVIVESNAEANQMAVMSFRQLKKLKLEQLPELLNISERGFPFEALSYFRMAKCEKLNLIKIKQYISQENIIKDFDRDWQASSVENQ